MPEIGYDPTVQRLPHNGEICYVYEVGTVESPKYYRTVELLFTARVLCITGRKTRVWKVRQVERPRNGEMGEDIGKEDVVLKDGWLDEGSLSEKEIQAAIFQRLRKIKPSQFKWARPAEYLHGPLTEAFKGRRYEEYFMKILDSRRFGRTKPCQGSAKPNPQILSFAEHKPPNPLHMVDGSKQTGNHSGTPADPPPLVSQKKEYQPRQYKTKEQHRLIYQNVGYTLSNAKDLSTSFRAVHDTFIGVLS